MYNLYYSENLVVTKQQDGSVFIIFPNTVPQVHMTITSKEWQSILLSEVLENKELTEVMHVLTNN